MGNKGPLTAPDLSLEGYVGLAQSGSGTGLYANDIVYFYLNRGLLYHAFTINEKVSNSNLALDTTDHVFTFYSESNPMMVNASEIFVEHLIQMTSYDPLNDTSEETIYQETVSYSLVKDTSGQFRPNKGMIGFNSRKHPEEMDSTYFLPEVYGFAKLSDLAENGTAKQKSLIRRLILRADSTSTFR